MIPIYISIIAGVILCDILFTYILKQYLKTKYKKENELRKNNKGSIR